MLNALSFRTKKGQEECAEWLDETLDGLNIKQFYLCGLSIGGWNVANYASVYPQGVKKIDIIKSGTNVCKNIFFVFP
jgi:pimeloyl-ACP methyl ester carboxylesterase